MTIRAGAIVVVTALAALLIASRPLRAVQTADPNSPYFPSQPGQHGPLYWPSSTPRQPLMIPPHPGGGRRPTMPWPGPYRSTTPRGRGPWRHAPSITPPTAQVQRNAPAPPDKPTAVRQNAPPTPANYQGFWANDPGEAASADDETEFGEVEDATLDGDDATLPDVDVSDKQQEFEDGAYTESAAVDEGPLEDADFGESDDFTQGADADSASGASDPAGAGDASTSAPSGFDPAGGASSTDPSIPAGGESSGGGGGVSDQDRGNSSSSDAPEDGQPLGTTDHSTSNDDASPSTTGGDPPKSGSDGPPKPAFEWPKPSDHIRHDDLRRDHDSDYDMAPDRRRSPDDPRPIVPDPYKIAPTPPPLPIRNPPGLPKGSTIGFVDTPPVTTVDENTVIPKKVGPLAGGLTTPIGGDTRSNVPPNVQRQLREKEAAEARDERRRRLESQSVVAPVGGASNGPALPGSTSPPSSGGAVRSGPDLGQRSAASDVSQSGPGAASTASAPAQGDGPGASPSHRDSDSPPVKVTIHDPVLDAVTPDSVKRGAEGAIQSAVDGLRDGIKTVYGPLQDKPNPLADPSRNPTPTPGALPPQSSQPPALSDEEKSARREARRAEEVARWRDQWSGDEKQTSNFLQEHGPRPADHAAAADWDKARNSAIRRYGSERETSEMLQLESSTSEGGIRQ